MKMNSVQVEIEKRLMDIFKEILAEFPIDSFRESVFLSGHTTFFTSIISINSIYWSSNNITLNQNFNLNKEDLITIAYLAKFNKERVGFNPQYIDNYLRCLGYDGKTDLMCDKNGDFITFEEWRNLGDAERNDYITTNQIKISDNKEIVESDLSPYLGNYSLF